MKINAESTITETNATGNSTVFKIKTSATAFKILSEGLYSNKIGSMIRELICNAYDAHCAAGTTDIPIDVELPMVTNPTFRIRDYGTGLSEADMQTIYTTYFESTKSGDNKYIGGFGLGSKTPLCYNTEQFFVCSYYNGKKYVYNVSIGSNGAPVLTKWLEENTDEPNGLELKISIDTQDITNFKYEFYKFMIWTDIKVNRIGYDNDFERVKYEPILPLGDAYRLNVDAFVNSETLPVEYRSIPMEKFDGYFAKQNFMVQVGKVAYFAKYETIFKAYEKIVPDYVNEILSEAERLSFVHNYRKVEFIQAVFGSASIFENIVDAVPPLCLKFNIGEVEVTASREDISYTESTIKTISIKLLGFLCACLLKGMKLTAEYLNTKDAGCLLKNSLVMSYVCRRFSNSLVSKTSKLLYDCPDLYTNANLRTFEAVVDGFELSLEERLSLAKQLNDVIALDNKQSHIFKALFTDTHKTLLKQKYDISIFGSVSYYAFFKDEDGIHSYSCAANSANAKVVNGEIQVIVSRLSAEEALKLPNLGKYGIDTTKTTLYAWVRVPTKISGERLLKYLDEANKLPNRYFTFRGISILGDEERAVVKERSSVRKIGRLLFSCTKKTNGVWDVIEDSYDNTSRDAVAEYLKKNETVFVLPVNYDNRVLYKNTEYFEDDLGLLLNLCLNTETDVSVAVVSSSVLEKFTSTYKKLGKGKVVVLTNTENECGKRLANFERQMYPFYRASGKSSGAEEIIFNETQALALYDEGRVKNDYDYFFAGLCLKENPHLAKCVHLIQKRLKANMLYDPDNLGRVMRLLRQSNILEDGGKKFDLKAETKRILKLVQFDRLKEIAAKIASLRPDVYYGCSNILTYASQAVIERLLDNDKKIR